MKRKMLIISALIVLIVFSSIAFAEEVPSNETLNLEEQNEEPVCVEDTNNPQLNQNEEHPCQAGTGDTFSDLNSEITSKNEINLTKNYTYEKRYDGTSLKNGIDIDRNITINGNNFTINGNGISTIFNVKNNAILTLNDVCIINTFTGDTSIINNQGNLLFNNVNLTSHRTVSQTGNGNFRDIYNTGSLTIINSNFIDSEFEISTTSPTDVANLNVMGFIDNRGELSIVNTIFDNNRFIPSNKFGKSHEISTILFNDAPDKTVILNNITVTNNKVKYTSSVQDIFRGFIRSENGNLIINNSLFENNTVTLQYGNSQRLGILLAKGNEVLINNSIFKTNEFDDAIITSYANNLVIMKSVFDSNTLTKNIIQNEGSGLLNVTHNLFINNIAPSKVFKSTFSSIRIDENYWGTNDPDFSTILSSSFIPTYLILNVTGPSEVHEKETTYNITLNMLNNGSKIENYSIYDYYIEVQSNNLGTSTPVELKNGIGHYIYAPIDKGEDLLTIGSIKLMVNVTEIFLSANIEIITEYENTTFAGTNNSIIAKVFVNKDFGIYKIKFYSEGVEIDETIEELSRTPKEIIFTDNKIRPIDQTTVAGENNQQINYTVEVFRNDDLIGYKTIFVPLVYNGYLGKEYSYPINDVEFNYNTTITGDILIQIQDEKTYMTASQTQREFEWRTVISSTSQFTEGFIYVPYNWDKTTTGPYPEFNLIFNDHNINNKIVGKYKDQSNMGGVGKLGYGVLIYNVTEYMKNGRNTLKIEKENGLTAVYPPTLITLFNTTNSETLKTIYIKNSADLLYNNYNLANRPIQANSNFTLENLSNIEQATLYVFAAGAGVDEADLKFNNKYYQNIWENSTGTDYHGAFIVDATNLLETTNKVTFISTGGLILSLQNILTITHPLIKEKTQIRLDTEYANTTYAGTVNTITVNVKINKTGRYEIKLFADGTEVANTTQELTKQWISLNLTDETIRQIDDTTVSGSQNQKINYTLLIYQNDKIVASTSLIAPLLYNEYFGKDYAYPSNNLEFSYKNSITGGILVQIQEDNTYSGADQTKRIDDWQVTLPENSNIVNGFLYISYNWNRTTNSNYPALSLTFNGRNIENKLVGIYKDPSNIGRYSYGLLIYDISDLIFKGQNSLTIKKESGLTCLYPSTLITIYNTTGSNNLKNVIINNGADLLSNEYNLANRLIQSTNNIEIIPLEKTTLYVFAASANNEDADLQVNNQKYSNIWKNYESTNQNGVFKIDISNIVKTNNTINFIATGGAVLALQQIIITETIIKNPKGDESSKTNNANGKTKKTTPKLSAKKKTFKVKAKNKKISATLKDKNGKAIKGAKITFKVKGKTYKATTNKKGIAAIKVKINKKGKYTVTVQFGGNKLYNSKTVKTKLIIKK